MATVRHPESGGAYREARANAEITQAMLAGKVGVTPRSIARYERGDTRPSPGVRDAIAETLGVDPASLPASEDPFVSSPTPKDIPSSSGFVGRLGGLFARRSR